MKPAPPVTTVFMATSLGRLPSHDGRSTRDGDLRSGMDAEG